MHEGFAPVFMNTSGAMSDLDCFKHELALADLAEPLGFDSIWQPEHHSPPRTQENGQRPIRRAAGIFQRRRVARSLSRRYQKS